MDPGLIAVLGFAGTLLSGLVMFILGQRWERKKQSLLIRAQMLNPIRNWLRGVEKFNGILGDTLVSVSSGSSGPVTYGLEERRKSAQFMIENTNEVLGILESESIETSRTRVNAQQMAELIRDLDRQVKYELLPLNGEILDRSATKLLTEDFVLRIGNLKMDIDSRVQKAYELVALINTRLT